MSNKLTDYEETNFEFEFHVDLPGYSGLISCTKTALVRGHEDTRITYEHLRHEAYVEFIKNVKIKESHG